ncbi:MAG: drug/metabolite transporter (DMT)-like permease [Woeseiaceae bacterium]|jgi:drug/metabolite transporter (DMT)-like permease|tara:strand:+ start:39 stop:995 length:957 start_codon:yes stop_codon:yes gene_type:complete
MKKITTNSDSFRLALGFLMIGQFCGLSLDILAKHLLEEYSLSQFIFARSLFALIIFSFIAPWYGGLESIKTKRWKWHFLRAVLSIVAMFGFFYGITLMPLVNALTLAYIAPLIVTALSGPLLRESVGWRRWVAVLIGFLGVLIILRPGSNMFSLASVSVLAAAISYALLAITARKLATTESTISMSVYVLVGPFVASLFFLPNNYTTPTISAWLIFFLAGLFSVGTWIGFINAYKKSSPVILAPFEYIALIGAAFAGYWIWQEIPDRFVIIGAFIIISSGLFVAYREMNKSQPTLYLRGFRSTGVDLIKRKLTRKRNI